MAIEVSINYLAVLVAAIISMILGALWYSPLLFGNAWMKSAGLTKEFMEKHKKGMSWRYLFAFLGSLLMAYVLAHFVDYTGSTTFLLGMTNGFWIWLGFFVPVLLGSILWEGKKLVFYFINITYHFISLLIMGGILAVWQ
ncbi:DUF1761 domain-containing protein [Candidatus Pacearchaeota archaeon]|nr:DUF1761 domain-containing protein [Candidatus Pacearchaeota archaeon]